MGACTARRGRVRAARRLARCAPAVLDLLDRVPDRDRASIGAADRSVPPVPAWGTRSRSSAQVLFRGPLLLPKDFGDRPTVYWAPFPPGDPITAVWETTARVVLAMITVAGRRAVPLLQGAVQRDERRVGLRGRRAGGLDARRRPHRLLSLPVSATRTWRCTIARRASWPERLAWRKGGLLYRLEAQVSKQRALELASSLEPR